MSITSSIIIILIILLISTIIITFWCIKKKIENLSLNIFGTKSLQEVFANQEKEYAETPKSLSGMDTILIPKINQDFPYLDINEMKSLAENAILLYLESVESNNLKLVNTSPKLQNILNTKIKNIANNDEVYSNIKFHRTVVNKYNNSAGTCLITFQTSLEYICKKENLKKKIQTRYITEFIYIYDNKNNNISLNCPNCGAPIKNLGQKKCEYCGTGVVDILSKTWQLNDIYES